jgi:hypothetical protein
VAKKRKKKKNTKKKNKPHECELIIYYICVIEINRQKVSQPNFLGHGNKSLSFYCNACIWKRIELKIAMGKF